MCQFIQFIPFFIINTNARLPSFVTAHPTTHHLILVAEEMSHLPGGRLLHLEMRIKTISLTMVGC
jgi:hypothetical protein